MLEGMHHISISVDDLEEARDFYAGLLELAEIDRPDLPNPGYWFQAGACQLHLTGRRDRASETSIPGTGAGETHFAFAASDLEPVKRRLETASTPGWDCGNCSSETHRTTSWRCSARWKSHDGNRKKLIRCRNPIIIRPA
ncbi:MAG: VOC family protein [Nitrospinae bacterium]|nr:VOC family protein [Nitrospinota bacterium]